MIFPTIDAHAHLDPRRSSAELAETGAVLAMTLSLDEAEKVLNRQEALIAWGVGCHPRKLAAQQAFNPERFARLAERTAVIGEVGLDVASRVPLELQLKVFRAALGYCTTHPHIISIHAFGGLESPRLSSTTLVLDELRQTPVIAPILHWWTGTASETKQAVELGCYFSVHSAVARRSSFRTQVPLERLLVESDHGWSDPPAAIPHRIAWVEYLLSANLKMEVGQVRRLAWQNLANLARQTNTLDLLPAELAELLREI